MRIGLVLVLLVSSWINSDARKSDAKSAEKDKSQLEAGEKRFLEVLKLKDFVVPLSDRNFTKFVSDRPRLYTAAIMFTAIGERYQCGICETASKHFQGIAEFYSNQYNISTVNQEQRLLFFSVDVESAGAVFQKAGIETVPRFFVLPSRKVGEPKQKLGDHEIDSASIIRGAQYALDDISSASGVEVRDITF